jgi:Mitosis protein DIM1
MFFFRNKHMMIDLGTGNNNKINWALEDKQEMIDIIETVYRGAKKGRGLVISPKDYTQSVSIRVRRLGCKSAKGCELGYMRRYGVNKASACVERSLRLQVDFRFIPQLSTGLQTT